MRLLTRYVLREILQVFLVTLFALTTLMVLVGAVREAIVQGLGIAQIVQLVPYLLPNALMFAVPGTILFSVSSVYGRMSGSNEIVAIKSLGLSPMVVLWPTLLVSVLLSFTTVWLNDLAMSWGYHGVQRVILDSLEDIAYGMLRSNHSFRTPAFSVTVQRVVGRQLISPIFELPSGDDSGTVTIRAESAELRSNPGSGMLTIVLYNGTADAQGKHVEFPNHKWERDIVIDPKAGDADLSPAHLALRQIPESLARQRETVAQIEQRMAAQAGLQMLTGDFDALAGGAWADSANQLQFQKYRMYRMQTEPPRRWANGFSCLCFALVGATMAIRRKNSDALTSFFLCFLPILLVYYPFLFFGTDRAKAGAINPYVVWLANAILVLWGLWLLRRVIRY
jgi:lipopolysaccharide export system permease protein